MSICNQHTLFIVDEASMISNLGLSGNVFGSGRLLDDLIQYVYGGQGCRLVLVGDTAQLPPVGEEESPALSADVLRGYGLEVVEQELTQVVRQESESGHLVQCHLPAPENGGRVFRRASPHTGRGISRCACGAGERTDRDPQHLLWARGNGRNHRDLPFRTSGLTFITREYGIRFFIVRMN